MSLLATLVRAAWPDPPPPVPPPTPHVPVIYGPPYPEPQDHAVRAQLDSFESVPVPGRYRDRRPRGLSRDLLPGKWQAHCYENERGARFRARQERVA